MKTFRSSGLSGGRGNVLPEPYRVGVYYAPAAHDPLWQAGCAWLGRDAITGHDVPQPDLPGLREHTKDARRYGLHGTLKAPFAPRHGFENFLLAARTFAAQCQIFELPTLAVTEMEGFIALCPASPAPRLHQLADECVRILDPHRTAESEEAQAKRRIGKTARQMGHIARFGYPYVFEDFFFHMTLTGQMENNPYLEAARAYFSQALEQPRMVDHIAIFIEEAKGSPFRLHARLPFAS